MLSFSSRKLAMLKQQLGSSIIQLYSVQDLLRLNYGFQRKKLNNKKKPRKTEKSINYLTISLRELEEWVLDPKFKVDKLIKEDSNSHQAHQVCQDSMDNTNNNSQAKEVVTEWEEEEVPKEEVEACQEVECKVCIWVVSLQDKECHIQARCHNKWDHHSLNNSQVECLKFLRFNCFLTSKVSTPVSLI